MIGKRTVSSSLTEFVHLSFDILVFCIDHNRKVGGLRPGDIGFFHQFSMLSNRWLSSQLETLCHYSEREWSRVQRWNLREGHEHKWNLCEPPTIGEEQIHIIRKCIEKRNEKNELGKWVDSSPSTEYGNYIAGYKEDAKRIMNLDISFKIYYFVLQSDWIC